MKRKLTILIMITGIFITGCSADRLEKAEKYMSREKFQRAEKIYQKLIKEEDNPQAYIGLTEIYSRTGQVEKLASVIEKGIEHGYISQDNNVYIDIIEYYDSQENNDKIIDLIGGSFSQVNLPISIYKKYLLKDMVPKDMDLIEMKSADITNNNENEIVVLIGKPEKNIDMNYYQSVKILVYNLKGEKIYEDYKDGGYLLYPKIDFADLNKDGVKDLYYNVIQDNITNAHTLAKVISFKDKNIQPIYLNGLEKLDLDLEIVDKDMYRIYSESMDESYTVKLDLMDEEQFVFSTKPNPVWREVYEKIDKNSEGEKILKVNFEMEGYAKIEVDYDYIEGDIKPVSFRVDPNKGRVQ